MTPLWLTTEQIKALTGRQMPAAQCRALDAMGIKYLTRPDGSPIVGVDHFRQATGCSPPAAEGDVEALARSYQVRGRGGNVVSINEARKA